MHKNCMKNCVFGFKKLMLHNIFSAQLKKMGLILILLPGIKKKYEFGQKSLQSLLAIVDRCY